MRIHHAVALVGMLLGATACAMSPPSISDRQTLHEPLARDEVAEAPTLEPADLTLARAVELALENNPSLRAEYARVEAMMLDVPQVSSLGDPMAMVAHQEGFRGPAPEREAMLTLSQTFPWFGKRALRGRLARSGAMEALEEYRAAALDLRLEVARAWHALEFEHRNHQLLMEEQELLDATEAATRSLYTAGQRDRGSLLRTQTESAMVVGQLHESDAAIELLTRELERLTRVRLDRVAAEEVELPELPEDAATLIETALDYRPELSGLDEALAGAALRERLARADYNPDVTLGVGYVGMGMRTSEFYSIDSDTRTDSWQASVGINLPLPNARRRAAVEQAKKQAEETLLREEALVDRIVESIGAADAALRSLHRQHAIYAESILPLAEEAFLATDAAYRSGRATYVDLLDAQRTLIAARRELIRLDRDYRIQIAELERTIGLPLELIPASRENTP